MLKSEVKEKIANANLVKVTFRERIIFDYKAFDKVLVVFLHKPWLVDTDILYGYVNPFSAKAISCDDIISIETV